MSINRSCKICGTTFTVIANWIPRSTCSTKCRYKLMSQSSPKHRTKFGKYPCNIKQNCKVCHKEFEIVAQDKDHIRETCSEECRYTLVGSELSIRDHRQCIHCDKEFECQPNSKKKLCSIKCRALHFIGINNPNWKDTKQLRQSSRRSLRNHILQRDKVCKVCGTTKTLQVHHIDGDSNNNSDPNLIILCKRHHAETHLNQGESNLVGLILANRTYPHKPKRVCTICNQEFIPKRESSICCSNQCAKTQSGATRVIKKS